MFHVYTRVRRVWRFARGTSCPARNVSRTAGSRSPHTRKLLSRAAALNDYDLARRLRVALGRDGKGSCGGQPREPRGRAAGGPRGRLRVAEGMDGKGWWVIAQRGLSRPAL